MAQLISIGQLSARTGASVSAIRFYEDKALIQSIRNSGGHRRFLRADVRRISFILIAQKLGFSLDEIGQQLASLPNGRNPTAKDWAAISLHFKSVIDARIEHMERVRDRLDGCIGCGCLSLKVCALYNPDDVAAERGGGPRYLLDRQGAVSVQGEARKEET